MAQKQTTHQH